MKTTVKQEIGAGACDPNGCLSLLGALTLVEDAVTASLDKVGINGINMRRDYGALVVFSKNHIQFLQPIRWQDQVTVVCFISAKSLARLSVDVCVKNQENEIAMYARTEVCAVDADSARIRRMDTVGIDDKIKALPPLHEMEWAPIDNAEQLIETVKVRTANIDYAGHTNNVEYIRLLLNTFTLEEWRGGITPRELQISYVSQSFFGDNLNIYCTNRKVNGVTPNERLYTIKKNEQDVLRCALRW